MWTEEVWMNHSWEITHKKLLSNLIPALIYQIDNISSVILSSWLNLISLQLMQTQIQLTAAVVTVAIALKTVLVLTVLVVVVQTVALSAMGVLALAVAALLGLHLLVLIIEIPLTQRELEQWRGDIMMTMNLLRQLQKGKAATHLQCKKYFLMLYLIFNYMTGWRQIFTKIRQALLGWKLENHHAKLMAMIAG